MSQPQQPLGPFKLVTVNTASERARRIVGRVVEAVKDRYTIIHAANVEGEQILLYNDASSRASGWGVDTRVPSIAPKDVASTVEEAKPDFLFCASMWTPEESAEIQAIAKKTIPGIKTMALPQGLQVERGPDGVFDYLMEKLPPFIES